MTRLNGNTGPIPLVTSIEHESLGHCFVFLCPVLTTSLCSTHHSVTVIFCFHVKHALTTHHRQWMIVKCCWNSRVWRRLTRKLWLSLSFHCWPRSDSHLCLPTGMKKSSNNGRGCSGALAKIACRCHIKYCISYDIIRYIYIWHVKHLYYWRSEIGVVVSRKRDDLELSCISWRPA